MPRFLANSFLGLNYVFSVQVWYICLNLIDLSKKVHFVYSKQNLRPKNSLQVIGASNLEGPLLKFQYSNSSAGPKLFGLDQNVLDLQKDRLKSKIITCVK